MGRLGYTYGSEWHLLRFLGYHRNELNRRIEDIIPGDQVKVINWIDFHFLGNAGPPTSATTGHSRTANPGCGKDRVRFSARRTAARHPSRMACLLPARTTRRRPSELGCGRPDRDRRRNLLAHRGSQG